MKRLFLLILLLFCVMLTGCQSADENIGSTYVVEPGGPTETPVLQATNTAIPATTVSATDAPVETPVSQANPFNAPASVNETVSTNTGKTVFLLDAAVEVPEFTAANVREVILEELPLDTARTLADLLIGEGAWEESKQVVDKDGLLFEEQSAVHYHWTTKAQDEYGTPLETVAQSYHWYAGKLDGSTLQYYTLQETYFRADYITALLSEYRGSQAQGCRYSSEEAIAMASEVAARIAPHLTEIQWGVMGSSDDGNDGSAGSQGGAASQAYAVIFTARVDDIPVTYTILENSILMGADERMTSYSSVLPNEVLKIVVADQGIVSLRWDSPSWICDPLESDVDLLPFESIMDVARTILPLKYAWQETSYDRVEYTIDRITFGYCRVRMKNDISRYILVPAWDFFGTARFYRDGELLEREDSYLQFNSLLTVNAMDGTVIDREEAY